jgi:hypothetical protein
MAEVIEVQIIADDSGLTSAFNNIADQAEEISSTAADVGENIGQAFDGSAVVNYEKQASKAATTTGKLSQETTKGSKSLGRFNRGAARGVSALSRFGGVGGKATRSLAGFGGALASTPFGVFAVGASAAVAALTFLYDKFKDNSAEILKRNKELNTSIDELEAQAKSKEIDLSLGAIELKEARGELSQIEAANARILKLNEKAALLQIEINARGKEVTKERNKLIDLTDQLGAQSEKTLKQEEKFNKLNNEQLSLIQTRQNILKQEQKEKDNLIKIEVEAVELRKKKEAEANKLINSLIRNEKDAKIQAIKDEAAEREAKAGQVFTSRSKLNKFLIDSENVKNEDIKKINEQFAAEELKAKKALLAQLITDEEDAETQAAKDRAEARQKAIQEQSKSQKETAELTKQNEAKLKADLLAIEKKFQDQRKAEQITKDNEILEVKQAAAEAQIIQEKSKLEISQEIERQTFAETKKTEEEITEFKKQQADERERQEIQSQIKRLEIIRDFNKQLTDEEKKAVASQIAALETQLTGVGQAVQKVDKQKDGKTLGDLLGIPEETQKDVKATQQALEQVTGEISKAVAERIALIQQEIDKRNERIKEIQGDLTNEIELNKLGKASNIRELQEQLNEEKAARDKAEKEKEEAAKAQFALDTALQASNLITSISALYSSLSGLPFGIGVALATALSAVLIGSFIASKASAAQAAGFAEGGYTGQGEKYEAAGVVHRGEWVITKEKTKALGLEGVAVSDFDEVMRKNYAIPNAKSTGNKNKMIQSEINAQYKNEKRQAAQMYAQGIKDAISGQNSILKGILKATENTPLVFPLENDKYLIQRGKNKTEIKRIKK